ncbi:MAG: DUF4388 domain-containing protein [Candidatus Methylomirabilia bacterium]
MELKGSIRNFPLPDVLQFIGAARRTGLLLVTLAGARASIFFEEGMIVHADYRDLAGQAVINRLFLEQEGSFQFLADATTDERNFVCAWMGAIMEAARVADESGRSDGEEFDGLDDLGGGGSTAATKAPSRPLWDAAPVKALMRAALRASFGRKAGKIERELEKCPATKLGLLDFCAKAEKFIYVFIDTDRARPVAERLRTIVEEPRP